MIDFADEIGAKVAEASMCKSASQHFKGICISESNCVAICQGEGFTGGECRGFRRRCICTKPCLEEVEEEGDQN
ncbi:Knottin [Macleaya cordata]|uniref:Knottin n=1 Tax=Macleaya cordata TaxID=56857 RepID=A0A200PZK1_MACCD|nr:Knottin [Macleaya cordata]